MGIHEANAREDTMERVRSFGKPVVLAAAGLALSACVSTYSEPAHYAYEPGYYYPGYYAPARPSYNSFVFSYSDHDHGRRHHRRHGRRHHDH